MTVALEVALPVRELVRSEGRAQLSIRLADVLRADHGAGWTNRGARRFSMFLLSVRKRALVLATIGIYGVMDTGQPGTRENRGFARAGRNRTRRGWGPYRSAGRTCDFRAGIGLAERCTHTADS